MTATTGGRTARHGAGAAPPGAPRLAGARPRAATLRARCDLAVGHDVLPVVQPVGDRCRQERAVGQHQPDRVRGLLVRRARGAVCDHRRARAPVRARRAPGVSPPGRRWHGDPRRRRVGRTADLLPDARQAGNQRWAYRGLQHRHPVGHLPRPLRRDLARLDGTRDAPRAPRRAAGGRRPHRAPRRSAASAPAHARASGGSLPRASAARAAAARRTRRASTTAA